MEDPNEKEVEELTASVEDATVEENGNNVTPHDNLKNLNVSVVESDVALFDQLVDEGKVGFEQLRPVRMFKVMPPTLDHKDLIDALRDRQLGRHEPGIDTYVWVPPS